MATPRPPFAEDAAQRYDAWYDAPRGSRIGEREFQLLRAMLDPSPGQTLLDVGCGTGYFSRRLAREAGLRVTGVDIDPAMLALAKAKAPEIAFVLGDARGLPFADAGFDHVVAMTSLCFVADEARAVREMARVARRRVAVGLLDRRSLLWWRKRGRGSYAGARWHARGEAVALLGRAGLREIRCQRAAVPPADGAIAGMIESFPLTVVCGGFLVATGTPLHHDTELA